MDMNILSEIQKFNADSKINKLYLMYKNNSLLNCLSVSRRELSHSMFLSELFKDDSFHGLGSLPLQLLLEVILHRANKQETKMIETGQDVMFATLKSAILARDLHISDIQVSTEESFKDVNNNSGKVDIFISCRVKPLKRDSNNKYVEFINIIIENKIYAKEQDDQTQKYYEHFNAFLKNKADQAVNTNLRRGGPRSIHNIYVYLTPATLLEIEGCSDVSCKCKEYVQICYQDILDFVLDPLLNSSEISQRGKFFIDEYRRSLGVSFEDVESSHSCSGKKGKVNTTIMAISKEDSDEISLLWNKYKDLFIATLNEVNRLNDDENEDTKCAEGKRTLYEYKGQPFSMNSYVRAIISDHLPEYNLEDINNKFNSIVRNIVTTNHNTSYFKEKTDVSTKDNHSVHIFQQWTEKGQYRFSDFCIKAKELWGYECKEYKKKIPSRAESMMLVAFYNKYEKLITTIMEVVKFSSGDSFNNEINDLIVRTKGTRDRSRYSVTPLSGNQAIRNLSRGRLVLTILQDYVTNSTEILSCETIIRTFDLPSYALKEITLENDNGNTNSGYFDNDDEALILAEDKKYLISKCWSDNYLSKFIKKAEENQYRIEKQKKGK